MTNTKQNKISKNYNVYVNEGALIQTDISNGYQIIAIFKQAVPFNSPENYSVKLLIKHNSTDIMDVILTNTITVPAGTSIRGFINKYVHEQDASGFFNQYIDRYEYMLKCLDKGNEIFEDEERE